MRSTASTWLWNLVTGRAATISISQSRCICHLVTCHRYDIQSYELFKLASASTAAVHASHWHGL